MKRIITLSIAALVLAVTVPAAIARAQNTATATDNSAAEEQELRAALKLGTPRERADGIKKFTEAHPKSALMPVARDYLVRNLIGAKAPAPELIAAADLAGTAMEDEVDRGRMFNAVAYMLAERGERLDIASTYAAKALELIPAVDELVEERANIQDTLGWIQVRQGEYAKAIDTLSKATATLPTSQEALYHLGVAYEKAGKTDNAIDAYIRSETVFIGQNDVAAAPLRALYTKAHGSLDGLDAKLAAAREASRKFVALESRRWDKAAPEWELKDLAGKPVKLSDFKGKTIVMDFWGSWCPPCRAELPKFQALHDKYKDKGNIVFLGMNWERGADGETQMKAVREFITRTQYTFPVIIDHDRVAVQSYAINGFPTVFIIDGQGMMRYRNVGYEDGVEQIIEAQIESVSGK